MPQRLFDILIVEVDVTLIFDCINAIGVIRGFNCSRPIKKSDLTQIQPLSAGTPPERRRNSGGIPPEFGRNVAGTFRPSRRTAFCDRQAQPGTFKSEFRTHSAYSAKIPRPSAVKKIRGVK